MYIIENKFSKRGNITGKDANKCIIKKNYPNLIINFLDKKKPDILYKFEFVVELDLCLSLDNTITTYYIQRKLFEYDLIKYKKLRFLDSITKIV